MRFYKLKYALEYQSKFGGTIWKSNGAYIVI